VYGRPCSVNLDPIEKKPLFHFLPGTQSLSIATVGCNFNCMFCQNHTISQVDDEIYGSEHAPSDIVDITVQKGVESISYTYTEPTIYFEYAYDIGVSAREKGIRNVFVSNGFMSEQSREKTLDFLDAINCDLKSFNNDTYKKIIGGQLEPVLDTIRFLSEQGVWVEVTTLLVPQMNDSDDELSKIAEFIASVSPSIPWHVSRFHPTFRMTDRGPTPVDRIMRALEIGKQAGLKYLYGGNIHGSRSENTICPSCEKSVIERFGFSSDLTNLDNGACAACGETIDGVWV
jgi:pyruvate formate lyase activating enzyme